MTKEQYDKADAIQRELSSLKNILHGYGDCKLAKIDSITVIHKSNITPNEYTMSFSISKELTDDIVKVIEARIENLNEQFKNL